jgi:hypothetical protein
MNGEERRISFKKLKRCLSFVYALMPSERQQNRYTIINIVRTMIMDFFSNRL